MSVKTLHENQLGSGRMSKKRIYSFGILFLILTATPYCSNHTAPHKQSQTISSSSGPQSSKIYCDSLPIFAGGSKLHLTRWSFNKEIPESLTLPDSANALDDLIIQVPNGAKFQISFPDSSTILLNAGSYCTYHFNELTHTNSFYLIGEMYADIKASSYTHFSVGAPGLSANIINGQFYINTYGDEPVSKIIFVKGTSSVTHLGQIYSLQKPGEYVTINKKSHALSRGILYYNIDTFFAHNNIDFMDQDIYFILRALSRWYDKKLIIKDTIPLDNIDLFFPRDALLTNVLEAMTKNFPILHYTLDSSTICITANKKK